MKSRQLITVIAIEVPDDLPDGKVGQEVSIIAQHHSRIAGLEVLAVQDENGDVLLDSTHAADHATALWAILEDVLSSVDLAMEGAGINLDARSDIRRTVEDYLANHYGED